jgi:hypothetical protein
VVTVTVSDGEFVSPPAEVTLTATEGPTGNRAPLADPGTERSVEIGTLVELDGTGSSDPDGDTLSFAWNFSSRPPESAVELMDAETATPSFTPDVTGDYLLRLQVSDGELSDAKALLVTVGEENRAPIASAGEDREVTVGELVTLDGFESFDPNMEDMLSYSWSFAATPLGSNVILSMPQTPEPFFKPDRPGKYRVRLVVDDGELSSSPDEIVLTAVSANQPPVAVVGMDRIGELGTPIELDGSGSFDPDDGPSDLFYFWDFKRKPLGSTAMLQDGTTATPTFVPDGLGIYIVELVVSDGEDDSTPVTVEFEVVEANADPCGWVTPYRSRDRGASIPTTIR